MLLRAHNNNKNDYTSLLYCMISSYFQKDSLKNIHIPDTMAAVSIKCLVLPFGNKIPMHGSVVA